MTKAPTRSGERRRSGVFTVVPGYWLVKPHWSAGAPARARRARRNEPRRQTLPPQRRTAPQVSPAPSSSSPCFPPVPQLIGSSVSSQSSAAPPLMVSMVMGPSFPNRVNKPPSRRSDTRRGPRRGRPPPGLTPPRGPTPPMFTARSSWFPLQPPTSRTGTTPAEPIRARAAEGAGPSGLTWTL